MDLDWRTFGRPRLDEWVFAQHGAYVRSLLGSSWMTWARQPSNLTSCSHSSPVGGVLTRLGAIGRMNATGSARFLYRGFFPWPPCPALAFASADENVEVVGALFTVAAFGFLFSRFPRCSLFAMRSPPGSVQRKSKSFP
jgi:hypothetical protein